MKNFFKKFWKDCIYVLLILSLIGCITILFINKENKSGIKQEIYGITLRLPNGTSYYFKSYYVQDELIEYRLANSSYEYVKDLITEIKVNKIYEMQGMKYAIMLIEYDGDITSLEYSWECIYHIEYR